MSSQTQGTTQRVRFSEKNLKTVSSSEKEQRQFRTFVDASTKLTATEKRAIHFATIEELTTILETANESKNEFLNSHKEGAGLRAKIYQDSAVCVSDFLKNFSPVLDIIRDSAPPFGTMAIGVISVLVLAAKNKAELEEILESTMSKIKDRLSGLKLYGRIYNDGHELDAQLQTHIVEAYQMFMSFGMAGTKYYTKGGPRRWLGAFALPADLQNKIKDVETSIVSIQQVCEELLHKRVDEVMQLNLNQLKLIKDLNAQLRDMQTNDDNNRVREIQGLLNQHTFSEEAQFEHLKKYRSVLESDEQMNQKCFQQMRDEELDSFRGQCYYQRWQSSPQQCLLILSSYNNESIDSDECWMSPVATTLIGDLQENGGITFAYSLLPPQPVKLFYDVLPAIILQLLRKKITALRDEKQHDELCSELQNFQKCTKSIETNGIYEAQKLAALQKVALRVVNFFDDSECVYIIVDRIDRCRDWKRVDHCKMLLGCLLKLVEGARCKLKVLAVIDGRIWPERKYDGVIGTKMRDRVIIHRAEQGYMEV